ncbi:MAG: transketolase [Erysipelotrichaceae bacterium]|jgi:transketolase|nr:transketolase [Erysipelotrichaceae bacterium]
MDIEALQKHAKNIRINIIKEVSAAQSGHPGGSLGAADIVTVLYFDIMDFTKDNAGSLDRDRFVLSKGHASPLLYAVLAEKGVISEDELLTFRKWGTRLQGHPDINELDGIDMSTGSLGQGISAAVGEAIANKLDHNNHRIYALLGDGECEEGQVWEAAMSASHYKLDNLCAIVDDNGLQIDGRTEDVIGPEPLDEKFRAFGWHVINVDGHDYEALDHAFREAMTIKDKPTCLIARTIKGKGVSFMENQAGWHGKAPDAELTAVALKDLEGN